MNELLESFAKYNKGANAKLVAALDALPAKALDEDRGSYYKSLRGLFNHIVGGELFSMKNRKVALPASQALAILEIDAPLKPGEAPFPEYEAGKRALAAFDAALLALAREIEPALLSKRVTVMGSERSVAQLLVSATSHSAHHRGQVAQILDEMGIENDFYMAIREA